MAENEKSAEKEGKTEKKRLHYLKARGRELKQELQAIKKESGELRDKLGIEKKTPKAPKVAK